MPHYLENLVESGLTVSHFPIEDGKVPADMADFLQLLTTMAEALRKAKGLVQYVHLTSSLYMLYINNLIHAYIFEVPETALPNLLPWEPLFIHSFIHSDHFYSASSSPLLLRSPPH